MRSLNAPDSVARFISHAKKYDGPLQKLHGMRLDSIHPVALKLRQNRE